MILRGLDSQLAAMRAAIDNERVHHAWLLAGPRGVGKRRFADQVARALLSADNPESQGAKLIDAGSHPDLRQLERLPNEKTGVVARNITVDQVRDLRALFATSTSISNRRVVIIDSVDDLERGAANALLKSLEEPPASTVFLLVSHQPGRLLPTIRSRCRLLLFHPLDDAAMRSILEAELPDMDAGGCRDLIAMAKGSAATAIGYARLDMAAFDRALHEIARTGDHDNAVRSKLAQSLSLKAAAPSYDAFVARVPAFIAAKARDTETSNLGTMLDAWSKARALSQIAIAQSLVAETVVFEMAGYVATLATSEGVVKA